MNEDFGQLHHEDGYVTATMTRDVDAPIAAVWRMLSEEAERVRWLAPGTIDLEVGGRARLDFSDSYVIVDSEVVACEPERLLAFSWSGPEDPPRPVRFELTERTDGTRITLSVSIPDDEVVARSCAGWEAHLTMLQAALAGVPIKFPLDRFKACRDSFQAELTQIMMAHVEAVRL